jgi:hypothetical protein
MVVSKREYFLELDDTRYSMSVELVGNDFKFILTVKNNLGMLYEAGLAREREGDLESYDDGDGVAHLARFYRYRGSDCRFNLALDIESEDMVWIMDSESEDEKEGLRFKAPLPLLRVYG